MDQIIEERDLHDKIYDAAVKAFLGLPEKAYFRATYAFAEPRPTFMDRHPRRGNLWTDLFGTILQLGDVYQEFNTAWFLAKQRIILTSFEIKPEDRILVGNQNDVLEMSREIWGDESLTRKQQAQKFKKLMTAYSQSYVPLEKYDGNYSLPVLAVRGKISPERLKVEWEKNPHQINKEFNLNNRFMDDSIKYIE